MSNTLVAQIRRPMNQDGSSAESKKRLRGTVQTVRKSCHCLGLAICTACAHHDERNMHCSTPYVILSEGKPGAEG